MTLTGKARKQFEDWFKNKYKTEPSELFYNLPNSMQWGVYLDWAEAMKYKISVQWSREWSVWMVDIHSEKSVEWSEEYATLSELQTETIKSLNRIINKQ